MERKLMSMEDKPSMERPHFLLHSSPGPAGDAVRVSIVIPVYRGEKTVGALVRALVDGLAARYQLEIVLVVDGSPDNSAAVCRRLAGEVPGVKCLNLSYNFGEHNAVMAGLNHATGQYAVIMDDDFQNPPEEVHKLVEEIRKGYDVVFSCYEKKQHSRLRNLASGLNNWLASLLLKKPRGLYLSSFKAISRFAIDEIIKYDGPYPYVDGLILRFTRNYSRVLVRHDPRSHGESGYTLGKLAHLWLSMFTNFSIVPLRMATFLGFAFSLLGLAVAVWFAVEKLRRPELPVGWASLVCSLLVIGGVQLFALGMIGEYLGRLFLKASGQPQFVIREIVGARIPSHCTPRKTSEALKTSEVSE
jgi:undecaprenyl-phosphate 4-deoxy-4-formamido-L-arabinose transferase